MWKFFAPLLPLVSCAAGLNILLTNDDSWASANIRYPSPCHLLLADKLTSPPIFSQRDL